MEYTTLIVKARVNEAIGDLIIYLSQYNFKIIYTRCKKNIEVDCISSNQ